MVKIRLLRDSNWVGDQRDPYVMQVSRVPCVGETIQTTGHGDPAKRGPNYYIVEKVMHYADYPDLAADVAVKVHPDHNEPPVEPLPKEQRLGVRRKKSA